MKEGDGEGGDEVSGEDGHGGWGGWGWEAGVGVGVGVGNKEYLVRAQREELYIYICNADVS